MTDLHHRLDVIPTLYADGWELLEDCFPSPASFATVEEDVEPGYSHGVHPESRQATRLTASNPPIGRDTQLRGLLVTAARHIDDALDHLHTHNPPTRRPAPFDTIGWVIRHAEPHGGKITIRLGEDDRVLTRYRPTLAVWEPDPTDLSCEPPTPGQVHRAILAIEAAIGWAYTADVDLTHTSDVIRTAHQTLRTLQRPAPDARYCERADCEDAEGFPRRLTDRDGNVCSTCRKRDSRRTS